MRCSSLYPFVASCIRSLFEGRMKVSSAPWMNMTGISFSARWSIGRICENAYPVFIFANADAHFTTAFGRCIYAAVPSSTFPISAKPQSATAKSTGGFSPRTVTVVAAPSDSPWSPSTEMSGWRLRVSAITARRSRLSFMP